MPTTTRFAPSPTGLLHLGHAFSAILNHDAARASGGDFRLRIEDIDRGRCRPEFEDAIFDDLSWLGLAWDGPVLRQSERFDLYREAISGLYRRGLIYRCFKTRAELSQLAAAPHGPGTGHTVTAPLTRAEEQGLLDEGRPFAWRLNAAAARREVGKDHLPWAEALGEETLERHADIRQVTDEVLARKDTPASYHLASVIDDAAQGVSLVYRGEDLASALPLHRLLQELLGLPAPRYRHHRLITDETGRRLAKRDRAATLRSLRDLGESPERVRRRLGLSPPRGPA